MTTNKGGRPRLAIGEFGNIPTPLQVGPSRYRARTRYRGQDGRTRTIARFGQTKKDARDALLRELDRLHAADAILDRDTPMDLLLDRWLAEIADDDSRTANTKGQYRYIADTYVRPRVGDLRVFEATTGRVDAVIRSVKASSGAALALSVRTVLRLAFSYAVRQGAATVNPVRETRKVEGSKKLPRALPWDEVPTVTGALAADPRAVALDLPDLVDMDLATAGRIGELLAVRASRLVLEPVELRTGEVVPGLVTIDATLIRPRGCPLSIQEHPKTGDAGRRTSPLPRYAVDMLKRRALRTRFQPPEGVIFGSPFRPTLRDPSNCAGDLREVMERLLCPDCGGRGWHPALKTDRENRNRPKITADGDGLVWNEECFGEPPYSWVTFHTFRKTALTHVLDEGVTPREAADLGGHANPAMTLNVYTARGITSARAAAALER